MNNTDKIIDVDLKKGKRLFFSFSIMSEKQILDKPKIRLIISVSNGISIILSNGKLTSDGEIEFQVPSMYGMLMPRKYYCELETIIDNLYFVPINFIINFY